MRSIALRAFVLLATSAIAACGGSYQGEGTTVTPGSGPSGTVASVNLVPNTTSLPANADGTAGGATGVTLTAIVLDANNNAVVNSPVTFSACLADGSVSPATGCNGPLSTRTGSPAAALVTSSANTNSSGVVQATLTTGGNPSLGTINVTATSGGVSKVIVINVVSATSSTGGTATQAFATNLNLAASSTQLASNASSVATGVTVTAFVTDSNKNAVPGVPVTFAASSGQIIVSNGTTDSSGQAVATLTTGGDSSPRCITVTVTAPQSSTASITRTLDCASPAPSTTSGPGVTVTSATTGTPSAATLTLLASSTELASSVSTTAPGIQLTALVKDANNNVIPGVTVNFTTPNSAAISGSPAVTDSSGAAVATVRTGGDAQNRPINITASTTNGVSGTTVVNVVRTTLAVTGSTTAQSGVATTYTATLLDSFGVAIQDKDVVFSYTGGTGSVNPTTAVKTNASGQAQVSVTPSTSGSVQAVALGLTASLPITVSTDCFTFSSPAANATINLGTAQTITVNWKTGGCSGTAVTGATINFSTTRGSLVATGTSTPASSAVTNGSGDATIDISAAQSGFATVIATGATGNKPTASRDFEFVATTPTSVAAQASPATIGTGQTSTVSAVVLDANNNLVKDAVVQFELTDTTGGTLSAGQATTNSQGKATVTYRASSTPSSANGVKIDVSVKSTPANPTITGVVSSTSITVGGAALTITLGTGNKLAAEGPSSGNTTYVMPWVIVVRDSAGNPVQNATVALSVHPVSYGKGCSAYNGTNWVRTDCSGGSPISCTSEDILTGKVGTNGDPTYDFNGILDPGEDLNNDGLLQPGGIVSVPGTVTLDANGTGQFEIRYPEDEAYWARVRLRATATVAGSESINQTFFTLPGLAADFSSVDNAPPGVVSPHGFLQDCAHEPVLYFTKLAQGAAQNSTVTANISLSSPNGSKAITLPFTVGGTAAQGTDFTVSSPSSCTTSSCSLTIPGGASASKIDVAVSPTAPTSTATFTLGTPDIYAVTSSTLNLHTVVLNGAAVSFAASSTSIDNGLAGGPTVKLDRTVGSTVSVPFTCTSVAPATEYTVNTVSPLTIPAGSATAVISVTNKNSTSADESLTCTLGTPSGPGALSSPSSTVITLSP